MFKKGYSNLLALLLSLFLILGFTACSSDDTSSEPENNDPPVSVEEPAAEPEPEPEPEPATPESYKLSISEWMELYRSGDAAVVVDLRTPEELEANGKFTDSININYNDFKDNPSVISEKLEELEIEKDATVLIHCAAGGRAGKALPLFQDQGYTSTYVLDNRTYFTEGGQFRYDLSLVEWNQLLASKNAVVVDLRTPEELEKDGKFANSVQIDYNDFKDSPGVISEKLESLGVPKDATVLIHCKSGGRAGKALPLFQTQGYTSTFALIDWTYFTEDGQFRYGLNPTEWDKLYTSGNAAVVIDVRTPEERQTDGKLPDSINIDNEDIQANPEILSEKLGELGIKKTDLILVHCKKGGRAGSVNPQLHEQGYTYAFYLDHALIYPEEGKYEYPDWELPTN